MQEEYAFNVNGKNYILKPDETLENGIVYDGREEVAVISWDDCHKKNNLLRKILGKNKKIDLDKVASIVGRSEKGIISCQPQQYKSAKITIDTVMFLISAALGILVAVAYIAFIMTLSGIGMPYFIPGVLLLGMSFVNIFLAYNFFKDDNKDTDYFTPTATAFNHLPVQAEVFVLQREPESVVVTVNDWKMITGDMFSKSISIEKDGNSYEVGIYDGHKERLDVFVREKDSSIYISIGEIDKDDASNESSFKGVMNKLLEDFLDGHEIMHIEHINEYGNSFNHHLKLKDTDDGIEVFELSGHTKSKIGHIDVKDMDYFNNNKIAMLTTFIKENKDVRHKN